MRERNLSQRILKNSNIVKWSRVESKTSPGIPDLHGFFADPKDHLGYTFWLELKLTKHNKVAITSNKLHGIITTTRMVVYLLSALRPS